VYNLSQADIDYYNSLTAPKDLEFEPYFDIDDTNPADGYESIRRALEKAGCEAYCLNLFDDYNAFFADYKVNAPDVIFNMVEIYKDKASLEMSFASLLEMMDVPYTGAPPSVLGVCQRKILTKGILSALGVRTPEFQVVGDTEEPDELLQISYPIIVKPSMEDASLGIEDESIVYDYATLVKRVSYIQERFKQNVLLEEYIDGRELNVAVIGDRDLCALPISEIDFILMPKYLKKIVSYQSKWDPAHESYHLARPVCPADLPDEVEYAAKELAVKACRALGCRDYARVDMRLNDKNELFVLEVNPNPDLTEYTGFMRSSGVAGYSFARTLKKIVGFAWARRMYPQV